MVHSFVTVAGNKIMVIEQILYTVKRNYNYTDTCIFV
jgi:hypothetical protein